MSLPRYLRHFGLSDEPFGLTPDPRFFYSGARQSDVLDTLREGIVRRRGFLVLSGEVGSGKTTVLRRLLTSLPQQVNSAYVFNTRVSSKQLVQYVLRDFGEPVADRPKEFLLAQLNRFLVQETRKGHNAVVVVDEAQNLTDDQFEEIRLLSNLETSTAKLIQILLVGQPELDDRLRAPQLRQLRQRITVRTQLEGLGELELEAYVMHRMQVAGAVGPARFTSPALRRIHELSRGYPRMVNRLCDAALQRAWQERRWVVDAQVVQRTVEAAPELAVDGSGVQAKESTVAAPAPTRRSTAASAKAADDRTLAVLERIAGALESIARSLDDTRPETESPSGTVVGWEARRR